MNHSTQKERLFGPLKCLKSLHRKKKTKKKEREREDVFDVLPERGREARVHAQGAPRLLLPRVCLFVCFFRRSLGETCGVVCCDLSRARVVGPEEDFVGFFFGLEFFYIILSL